MVYIYKDGKGRFIVSENPIPDLPISLIFSWNSLPSENIRPWKILGISADLYKPGLLNYLEKWKESETAPPKETLNYVYRKEVDLILGEYKEILNLLVDLNLISQWPELKYKRFIVFECDIRNYLEDILGNYILGLVDKYKNLGNEKKKLLQKLSKIQGRENKLDFLKDQDIDLDIFTFLPPWFKSSYQVFGQQDRIVRNSGIEETEYHGQDRIDGYIGESLIRENIYGVFYNGEILSAKEIKSRLAALYQHLGLQRIARVGDLDNYFEVMRTYSRLYRLDRKKII